VAALGSAAAFAVGLMFIVSGAAKLRTGTFAGDLADYRVLPPPVVLPIAAALPWIEIFIGGAILVVPRATIPLIVAAVLLVVFTGAVVVNLARGRHIACGCRGTSKPITWRLAAANVAWITAALAAAQIAISPALSLSAREPRLSSTDAVAVLTTVVVVATASRLVDSWIALTAAMTRFESLTLSGPRA